MDIMKWMKMIGYAKRSTFIQFIVERELKKHFLKWKVFIAYIL